MYHKTSGRPSEEYLYGNVLLFSFLLICGVLQLELIKNIKLAFKLHI